MLNIVVPMAGRGSRFATQGFVDPKPLIPVAGRPMIERVISNLRPRCAHRFVFLCLEEHLMSYPLRSDLGAWAPGCEVISVDSVTEGAACTVLQARDLIASSDGLMIANSDQWIDIAIDDYLGRLPDDGLTDGLIMTMTADHPKWSYVRIVEGRVVEVVEKVVVSTEATVGIYNFRRGSDFVRAADEMIKADARVNGEFYVAPTYNWLLAENAYIAYYNVGTEGAGMHGLGTPEDLAAFLGSGRLSEVGIG